MREESVKKFMIVVLVIFITAIFLSMIRSFLMAIFLAGLFAALTRPAYRWLERKLGGRSSLASVLTLVLIVLTILVPLGILAGVVTGQAVKVSQSVMPWVRTQIEQPNVLSDYLDSIPYYDKIAPHRELILKKAGEAVGKISQFIINNLQSAALGAANFLFILCIWLYIMYFFLMDGELLLEKILYYLPLEDKDEQQMLDRFTSVARATLKGSAVIGFLQGGLAGLAFWVAGIPSSAFWGTIMVVLSIIPSVGTAIVWVPAAIILCLAGSMTKGILLAIFCGLVVGSLDNVLRPILVGKDTQMHELMIFFGTLGGIFMFGMVGVIIGPIIAALFVTIWEIYGQAFADILPDTGYVLMKKREAAAREHLEE